MAMIDELTTEDSGGEQDRDGNEGNNAA